MQFNSEPTSQPYKPTKALSQHRGWGFPGAGQHRANRTGRHRDRLAGYFALKNNVNVGKESSNIQSLITSTQNMMKGGDGYTFTSGAKMMGSLIQMKLQPKSMTVRGTPLPGLPRFIMDGVEP